MLEMLLLYNTLSVHFCSLKYVCFEIENINSLFIENLMQISLYLKYKKKKKY